MPLWAVQVPDPSQPTIQAANTRQSEVQHFAIGFGSAAPQACVSQPPSEPEGGPLPASMEVVGECPGDKRRREHLAQIPLGSNAGDISHADLPPGPGEEDEESQLVCPSRQKRLQSAPSSHEVLRRQLMAQNAKNVESRKAKEPVTQRSMPY